MKNILIMAVTLFMLATSMASRAEPVNTDTSFGLPDPVNPGGGNHNKPSGKIKRFVALWEGVDPEDGALNVLSITNNNDGTVKLLLYATFLTTCNGGRGIAQGTGEVSGKKTLKSEDFAVTCFDPPKDPLVLKATLVRNPDGTLTWDRSAEPESPPTIVFHQISK